MREPTQRELELALELATRHNRLLSAQWALEYFGVLCFGIESVECAGAHLRYVNRGDTYRATITRQGDEYAIQSWGAWYESTEQEHCAETDTVRCGYCSAFTPVENNDWQNTVCESCGKCVAG